MKINNYLIALFCMLQYSSIQSVSFPAAVKTFTNLVNSNKKDEAIAYFDTNLLPTVSRANMQKRRDQYVSLFMQKFYPGTPLSLSSGQTLKNVAAQAQQFANFRSGGSGTGTGSGMGPGLGAGKGPGLGAGSGPGLGRGTGSGSGLTSTATPPPPPPPPGSAGGPPPPPPMPGAPGGFATPVKPKELTEEEKAEQNLQKTIRNYKKLISDFEKNKTITGLDFNLDKEISILKGLIQRKQKDLDESEKTASASIKEKIVTVKDFGEQLNTLVDKIKNLRKIDPKEIATMDQSLKEFDTVSKNFALRLRAGNSESSVLEIVNTMNKELSSMYSEKKSELSTFIKKKQKQEDDLKMQVSAIEALLQKGPTIRSLIEAIVASLKNETIAEEKKEEASANSKIQIKIDQEQKAGMHPTEKRSYDPSIEFFAQTKGTVFLAANNTETTTQYTAGILKKHREVKAPVEKSFINTVLSFFSQEEKDKDVPEETTDGKYELWVLAPDVTDLEHIWIERTLGFRYNLQGKRVPDDTPKLVVISSEKKSGQALYKFGTYSKTATGNASSKTSLEKVWGLIYKNLQYNLKK